MQMLNSGTILISHFLLLKSYTALTGTTILASKTSNVSGSYQDMNFEIGVDSTGPLEHMGTWGIVSTPGP